MCDTRQVNARNKLTHRSALESDAKQNGAALPIINNRIIAYNRPQPGAIRAVIKMSSPQQARQKADCQNNLLIL